MVSDGGAGVREVRYLRRRRLPDPRDTRPLAVHRVTLADRLDLVAAAHLGDPLAAWQIADANIALDPSSSPRPTPRATSSSSPSRTPRRDPRRRPRS